MGSGRGAVGLAAQGREPGHTETTPTPITIGRGPANVEHVGIFVDMESGRAVMVDAPYTGADVLVELFPTTVGASWGTDTYLGATTTA